MNAYDAHIGGAGEPLVLLHGINMTWRIWLPVIPQLERHHTVMAPTLAGHRGGPPLLAGPQGIGPLADAVEAWLDGQGLHRVHMVGNSLGGWLACELASRGRALSLTAFSPAGAWDSEKDFRRLARLMRLARRSAHWRAASRLMARERLRKAFFAPALERGDRIPADVALEMLADTRACILLEGLLADVAQRGPVRTFDVGPSVPTVVAWPERDRTIPFDRYGKPYLRILPSATLQRMPGVGHVPMFDAPELVGRIILGNTSSGQ